MELLDQIVLLQIQLQYCVFNGRENESDVLRICGCVYPSKMCVE